MRTGILTQAGDLSAYVHEILKTWGCTAVDLLPATALTQLDPRQTPVLIRPASCPEQDESILAYVHAGGTAITMVPSPAVTRAAGLQTGDALDLPRRLRFTGPAAPGVAGEELPVVGRAVALETSDEQATGLAYLAPVGRFDGETVGVTRTHVGDGALICFAFDLPLCILLLRQGDPAHAERTVRPGGWVCTENLGTDIGPADCSLLPFADLLARWLVDLVRRHTPAPMPTFWHLPAVARGLVLYSGDEDNAPLEAVADEFDYVTGAGHRMSLYIIPDYSQSSDEDIRRYSRRHDLGAHPNLRRLDGKPVAERVASFEQQVLAFEARHGIKTTTVRNHCLAWPGYLELVEAEQRLGLRMDANYLCSAFMRDRCSGPYHVFGSAMPMRFADPESGRLFDVFQQHTHLSDDVWFHPTEPKSFRISPEQYQTMVGRILDDMVDRFHTPYGVIIHPGNWAQFSSEQGKSLIAEAQMRDIPVWSYDQWCRFWDLRDRWRVTETEWKDDVLRFTAAGPPADGDLSLMLPAWFGDLELDSVVRNGLSAPLNPQLRAGETVYFASIDENLESCQIEASYARSSGATQ